jgi:hypothetical protein
MTKAERERLIEHHHKMRAFHRTNRLLDGDLANAFRQRQFAIAKEDLQGSDNTIANLFSKKAELHSQHEQEHTAIAQCLQDAGEQESTAKAAGFSVDRGAELEKTRVSGIVPAGGVRMVPRAGQQQQPSGPTVDIEFEKMVSVDD